MPELYGLITAPDKFQMLSNDIFRHYHNMRVFCIIKYRQYNLIYRKKYVELRSLN